MILVHYRGDVANFGDDLNTILWPALAPGLLDDDETEAFVGIGTIIGRACAPGARLHVFSSGAGNDPVSHWAGRDVRYWCVRGPLTAALLGLAAAQAITDGALLVPLAPGFPRAASGGERVSVIPHFQTVAYPGWAEACALAGFDLLDPRGAVHDVIARIAASRLVLTESLHGAILADAYGIPWQIFATSGHFGSTKFFDWCQSVEQPCRFTYVPPPDARQLLAQGKGACRWGEVETMSVETSVSALEARLAPARAPGWRDRAKALLRSQAALRRLLGYSPARTAAALAALAAPQLSAAALRARLQERLLLTLDEVRKRKEKDSSFSEEKEAKRL